jgi:gas vesicle protein
MRNDGREYGFTAGVVTGALIGAGLALLFAPKAGAELRHDLNGSMSAVRDAVARRYQALAEMAGVELENLDERVDRAAEAIESSAREVLDSATAARRRTRAAGVGRS